MATKRQAKSRMSWVARGVGTFIGGLWLIIAVGEVVAEPLPSTFEGRMMAGLTVGCIISTLLAWWREDLGGILLVVCAITLSTFAYLAAGNNWPMAVLVSGGPFLLSGILFLMAAKWSHPVER